MTEIKSTTNNKKLEKSLLFWLTISLACGFYYGFLAFQQATSSEYVVQDDARVYVFWMQRFLEPDLLANDLMANYFQSVTPLGYAVVYKIMAQLGIAPLAFSKILPIILGVTTSIYSFFLV